MVRVKSLQEAPTLDDFLERVRQEEKGANRHQISTYDLKLYPDGMLKIASKTLQGTFPVSEEALPDIARIAKIPGPYFERCDHRLRSVSFNWRLHKKVVPKKPVQVVLRGGVVDRILNSNLLSVPWLALMDTVSNAKPEKVPKKNLRVINSSGKGAASFLLLWGLTAKRQ